MIERGKKAQEEDLECLISCRTLSPTLAPLHIDERQKLDIVIIADVDKRSPQTQNDTRPFDATTTKTRNNSQTTK